MPFLYLHLEMLRPIKLCVCVCVYIMPLISLLVFFKYSDILRLYCLPVMDYITQTSSETC